MRKKKKKIGVFVGKFFPLHFGHIMQVAEIAKKSDLVYVILADSEQRTKHLSKENNISYLSPKTRCLWLREYFCGFKNVKVKYINQGMLEAYPDELENWKKKLLNATEHNFFTWYVDKNYYEISKSTFPEFNFAPFNRNNITLSAKQIRENPKKTQELMPKFIYNKFKKLV